MTLAPSISIRKKRKDETREALIQAVLEQSTTGQAFSSLSLRQVTRMAGVVPTAFYRHFADMESLGKSLVEDHLNTALSSLRKRLMMGQVSSSKEQISVSVEVFFDMVDEQPNYFHFLVAERWGGSPSVVSAVAKQLHNFAKLLSRDLKLLPAFSHINKEDKMLLAEMGVNLYIGWIVGWLELPNTLTKNTKNHDIALTKAQEQYKAYCTRQARILFYGASNWDPKS